ncbi:MAG TPA: DinB family protein [Chitinophagaceae bacterium]|jgi:uncharacterized damage-inducible protein DinB|nr:DinB family protein [Chitinophagaceae bacterium]
MNKEIQSIITNLERVNAGQPWYGRAVYDIFEEIDPSIAYKKPNDNSHSLIELLYHMITWADFTLHRIQGYKEKDMTAFEELDWREIDPAVHTWEKGLVEFKAIHKKIVELLNEKDDEFLKGIVDYRKYNFRFLLNGLIQHNIYHIGQVALMKKLLQ